MEDRNLQYRTIAVYKCALQLPLKIHLGVDLSDERVLRFMEGAYNLCPPAGGPRMPLWLLDDVLAFLSSYRFEPLSGATFKDVTRKTLVLLLLASGRRVSEIASLSRSSSWRGGRLVLDWLPSFKAKYDKAAWKPSPPSILRAVGAGDRFKFLCPVRAYYEYVRRRNRFHNLFNEDYFWLVQQVVLANAFRSVVRDAMVFAGKHRHVVSYPHMTKKLAISYSLLYFPHKRAELPALTGNKNMGVIKKVYAHVVPPLRRFPVVVPLGTVNPDALG